MHYEERRVIETVPREVVMQDYYAVEKRVQYFKEIVPERRIEMEKVEKKVKRYEYVPVEKYNITHAGRLFTIPPMSIWKLPRGRAEWCCITKGLKSNPMPSLDPLLEI
jgi:hypothetical protein